MKKLKEKKAITLIALVVTIVVLLILAGISISMLTGQNSILIQAGTARDKTIIGQEKEQVELAYVAVAINKLGNSVTSNELQNELNKSVGENKTEVTYNGDKTLNVFFNDTAHNYNVNEGVVEQKETIPVTNPYENEGWVMAWTCTDGVWSDTINAGEEAEGDIIAKLYKTGNKIKPDNLYADDFSTNTFIFPEGDEYKMVIEGNGDMGDLMTATGSTITGAYGWQKITATYIAGYTDTCIIPYISEIIICDGITSTGAYAFVGDTSLKKVIIGNDVITIGDFSFAWETNLEEVTIPNTVTTLKQRAFVACECLKNIEISNNLTTIEEMALGECLNLKKVFIPSEKISYISVDAFWNDNNTTVYFLNEELQSKFSINFVETKVINE